MSFKNYVSNVSKAINERNGTRLKELLSLNNEMATSAIFQARQNPRWDPQGACTERLDSTWAEIVAGHCRCLSALQDNRFVEAYTHEASFVSIFNVVFRDDSQGWLVDAMLALGANLKVLAESADEELKRQGKEASKVADCVNQLRQCFSVCAQRGGNSRKKVAAVGISNISFKIFLRTNSLHLCKTLVRSVEVGGCLDLPSLPPAHLVTFKYYIGRYLVFNEDYAKAEAELATAFQRCHKAAIGNKRRILTYLIPVQLLLGNLPSRQLMAEYKLDEYSDILQAMRSGSIQQFDAAMTRNQYYYIQAGTYLLLEKLRNAVYRRLLKRVALIYAQIAPDKSKAHQLPLGLFQAALRWQGEAADYDEVECIVANLIFQKYVKGYMSHKMKVVVLSKDQPFPPMKQVDM